MDANKKQKLINKLEALKAMNQVFKSATMTPLPPAPPAPPGAPINLQPSMGLLVNGLKKHSQEYEELLSLLKDVIKEL